MKGKRQETESACCTAARNATRVPTKFAMHARPARPRPLHPLNSPPLYAALHTGSSPLPALSSTDARAGARVLQQAANGAVTALSTLLPTVSVAPCWSNVDSAWPICASSKGIKMNPLGGFAEATAFLLRPLSPAAGNSSALGGNGRHTSLARVHSSCIRHFCCSVTVYRRFLSLAAHDTWHMPITALTTMMAPAGRMRMQPCASLTQ